MIRRLTGSWFLTLVMLVGLVCLNSRGFAQSLSSGTNIGSSTSAQMVTLTFTVAGTLNSINVVTQGVPTQDFVYAGSGTCATGTSYAIAASCTVGVTFSPKYPGLRAGAVVLRDSSSNALATTFISGIGNGPQVALLPGVITTVAGNGSPDSGPTSDYTTPFGDGGPATSAKLDLPYGVAVDGAGNLYINEGEAYSVIRKVDASGTISTVVGDLGGDTGYYGDSGKSQGVVVPNNVVVNGVPENDGVILNGPIWVSVDGASNLYINDYNNNLIREIDAVSHIITTVVGSYPATANCGSSPGLPNCVIPPNQTVATINAGGCSGDGGPATQPDGTALTAPTSGTCTSGSPQINGAVGFAFDGAGNMYIADKGNNLIRKVDAVTQKISTFAGIKYNSATTCMWDGDNGAATSAHLCDPSAVAVDASGNVYIADSGNHAIREIAGGNITTVAGTGSSGYSSDGTLATSAKLNFPLGIAVDAAGNVYFAENGNNIIRKVDASTQKLITAAGTYSTTGGYGGDGGPATGITVLLNSPAGISLDSAGNLYIADTANNRIRKVAAASAALVFPATSVGAKSVDQAVTASNIGNTTSLSLTGTAITTGTNFKIDTTTSTCPTSLLPGASCVANVYFAPTASGALSDSLVFTDNTLDVNGSTQPAALSGTGTQTQVTASVTAANKPYDGTTAATITACTLSGSPANVSCSAAGPNTFSDASVGNGKTVTATNISLSGSAASGYLLSSTTATTTANITAASLTASVTAANKLYDGTTAATITACTLSGSPANVSCSAGGPNTFSNASVGNGKTVTATSISLSGSAATNYQLSSTTATTTANITAASLTASVTAANKLYDGTTAATITACTLSGSPANVSCSAGGPNTFSNASVGNGKTVTATSISLSGSAATNYQLSSTTATTTANITAASLTASVTAANKPYDGTTAATITACTLSGSPANVSCSAGGPNTFSNASVGNGKTVTATSISLSGSAASSYQLSSITATTTANITAKGLTVTATNQTITSGGTIPSLTYTITGFVNGETAATAITGVPACSTTATSSSPLGSYPITCTAGSLSAANYSFTFVAGSLAVGGGPRVVTLPMTNVNATTVSVDGIVNSHEAATTYWFEYGTRPTLAGFTRTSSQTLPAGVTEATVNANLTGLTPHTVYYFRVVAQNSIGTSQGQILNFRSGEQGVRAAVSNTLASPIVTASTSTATTANHSAAAQSATGSGSSSSSSATAVKPGTVVSSQTAILEVGPGRNALLVVSLPEMAAGTPITATCAGLPEGSTCSYDGNSQTVTIAPAENTPPGSYPVSVTYATGSSTD